MNEYSTDAALDALTEQEKAFEDKKDAEIEAAEDAADEQVKILKEQLDDEVALRQQAIRQINRDYQTMLDDVRRYFEELGITIDEELLQKLTEGLELVAQFGSYDSAGGGISTSIGGLNESSISALVNQMKSNSQAWWDAKTPGSTNSEQNAEQQRLAQENERIAELLKQMGLDIWKENGQWFIRLNGTVSPLFSVYHAGGVAGNISNPKADEIFALLRKGEVVLNEDQQSSLLNILDNAGKWMQNQVRQTIGAIVDRGLRSHAVIDDGRSIASFAPNIEVNIHHNGNMSDSDARRYGNEIADVALDKLWSTLQRRGIT